MEKLKIKRVNENEEIKEAETLNSDVRQFLDQLKVDGRYFVGNSERVGYIQNNRRRIDDYLDALELENEEEAKIYRELVKINARAQAPRQMDPFERLEKKDFDENEIHYDKKKSKYWDKKRELITPYSSRPRRTVERFLLLAAMGIAVGTAFYVGEKLKGSIDRLVSPYVERIYKAADMVGRR
jgi:hypothetical protein